LRGSSRMGLVVIGEGLVVISLRFRGGGHESHSCSPYYAGWDQAEWLRWNRRWALSYSFLSCPRESAEHIGWGIFRLDADGRGEVGDGLVYSFLWIQSHWHGQVGSSGSGIRQYRCRRTDRSPCHRFLRKQPKSAFAHALSGLKRGDRADLVWSLVWRNGPAANLVIVRSSVLGNEGKPSMRGTLAGRVRAKIEVEALDKASSRLEVCTDVLECLAGASC